MEIAPLQLNPSASSLPSLPSLGSLGNIGGLKAAAVDAGAPPASLGFQNILAEAIGRTNQLSHDADDMVKKFATGEVSSVHDVMIAMEKASLAQQMTMQVRNKILTAYQSIMAMQV